MIIFFEPKDTKLDDLADLAMICYAKSKVYFKTAVGNRSNSRAKLLNKLNVTLLGIPCSLAFHLHSSKSAPNTL